MGSETSCSKEGLNRGAWTSHEDKLLADYISTHGQGRWRTLPKKAGLKRCGKSCRLRWLNYLRPDIKRGNISLDEEELIIRLHKLLGNRWSLIAGRLPGRTDNEIKNYWNSTLGKKVSNAGSSKPPENKKLTTGKSITNKRMRSEGPEIIRTEAIRVALPDQISTPTVGSQQGFPATANVNDGYRPSSSEQNLSRTVVKFGAEEVCMGEIIGNSIPSLINTSNGDYYNNNNGGNNDIKYITLPYCDGIYSGDINPREMEVECSFSFAFEDVWNSFLLG